MWKLSLPWWEFIIRGLVVYFFLIIILRLTGKRQIGQMTPFDLVLLLVLSNAVQNSMNGGDNSVVAGVILSLTLVTANWIAGRASISSKLFGKIMRGEPRVLVHDGVVNAKALQEENISRDELMASIRDEGYEDVLEVRSAILEVNGSISIVPLKHLVKVKS
jgi:uncharacterized membrane protein YcaP (DUF421 family)